MVIPEKASCPMSYRKPGKDTLHCKAQINRATTWDFCKHQYFCQNTKRYEMSKEAAYCTLANQDQ